MNNIKNDIERHIKLLNKTLEITETMSLEAKKGDVEEVHSLADNRERLLNIINGLQAEIETQLKTITNDASLSLVARNWVSRTDISIKQIFELDDQVILALNDIKKQTSQEIGSVYKQKQSIRGYNLNNVK